MSLAADFKAGPPVPARVAGKIDTWLDSLEPAEREGALGMLRSPAWRSVDIVAKFLEHGLEISPQSIGAYRKALSRVSG